MPPRRNAGKAPVVPVRGGFDELPHNLGKLWTPPNTESGTGSATDEASFASAGGISGPTANARIVTEASVAAPYSTADISTSAAPAAAVAPTFTEAANSIETTSPLESPVVVSTETAPTTRYGLRPRKKVLYNEKVAARSVASPSSFRVDAEDEAIEACLTEKDNTIEQSKKRQRSSKNAVIKTEDEGSYAEEEPQRPKRKARKTKDNPYGLTPGETPYPQWESPTKEQCYAVYKILVDMHDDVQPLPPENIPAPSLEVAGCGEVPSVLDGLIRTVLSGSTTFDTADKMLQALVKKFGVLEEGVGKGSVNWNNVRTAEYDEVYEQLKAGGLGGVKAKNIQEILNMVYEENKERRAAYLQEKETGIQADVVGASEKTEGQKKLEILKADQAMLSLDHMHDMTKDEALRHFVKYPGVGVKTAACVTLFSLQRPCFAVDTHVFRMSRWLGWVPQKTDEDLTFSHLEVRCPDELKYGLHQLFIRHGKTCHRCNDKSFLGTKDWDEAVCPLESLVDRFTKRVAKPKEQKGKKTEKKDKKKLEEGDGSDQEMDDADEVEDNLKEAADELKTEAEGEEVDKQDDGSDSDSELSELSDLSDLSELDEAGMNVEAFDV
jgi:endonuclease III